MTIQKINLYFVTAVFGATMALNPALAIGNLPPGISHAPGIEKRIERGKGLPPGIQKNFVDEDKDEHPDKIAPVIQSFLISGITSSSAVADIRTDEATRVKVFVSSSSPLVEASSSIYSDAVVSSSHHVILSGLNASTTYYVMVKATDKAGNSSASGTLSFTTLVIQPLPDVTAPLINSLAVSAISSSSAAVVVRSNESVSATLYLSAVSPLVQASSSAFSQSALDNEHTFVLSGLSTSTSYYYVIRIQDSAGNSTVSAEQSFKTEPLDITAPSLFGPFELSVSQNSAILIWFTPERSDSSVWFSTSSTVDTSTVPNVMFSSDVYFHSVTLTGLSASTTYHYVVGSSDASSNTALSAQGSFTTKM